MLSEESKKCKRIRMRRDDEKRGLGYLVSLAVLCHMWQFFES